MGGQVSVKTTGLFFTKKNAVYMETLSILINICFVHLYYFTEWYEHFIIAFTIDMEGLHGGHVGWQEQYKFSPLGKKIISCKNISLFLPSNMATM